MTSAQEADMIILQSIQEIETKIGKNIFVREARRVSLDAEDGEGAILCKIIENEGN